MFPKVTQQELPLLDGRRTTTINLVNHMWIHLINVQYIHLITYVKKKPTHMTWNLQAC